MLIMKQNQKISKDEDAIPVIKIIPAEYSRENPQKIIKSNSYKNSNSMKEGISVDENNKILKNEKYYPFITPDPIIGEQKENASDEISRKIVIDNCSNSSIKELNSKAKPQIDTLNELNQKSRGGNICEKLENEPENKLQLIGNPKNEIKFSLNVIKVNIVSSPVKAEYQRTENDKNPHPLKRIQKCKCI